MCVKGENKYVEGIKQLVLGNQKTYNFCKDWENGQFGI